MTHSPQPLTEEYSYALSWQAATERFEAAGCLTVAEAEAMANAIASEETGIEVSIANKIYTLDFSFVNSTKHIEIFY